MIKVMEVYNDMRDTADEVMKVLQMAGLQVHPAAIVGLTQMVKRRADKDALAGQAKPND